MDGIKKYSDRRWYKVVNGGIGVAAIIFALLFFVIVILIYILRIWQSSDKKLSRELLYLFTGDDRPTVRNRRKTAAKYLRATVFLLLAVGFVAVIYYNVKKMVNDDPLVSVSVKDNEKSPSILFCGDNTTSIEVLGAEYYFNLDDLTDANVKPAADLTDSFNEIIMGKERDNCMLFNETLFTKPK